MVKDFDLDSSGEERKKIISFVDKHMEFSLGDTVYYDSSDSPQGRVLDWRIFPSGEVHYLVIFNFNEQRWVTEREIVVNKPLVF